MTKLLNLNLTDEELKSAQPPKPKANAWEQYFPDCKPSLRSLSRTDSADFASPVDSPVPAKVKPDEIVPREVSQIQRCMNQSPASSVHTLAASGMRN